MFKFPKKKIKNNMFNNIYIFSELNHSLNAYIILNHKSPSKKLQHFKGIAEAISFHVDISFSL